MYSVALGQGRQASRLDERAGMSLARLAGSDQSPLSSLLALLYVSQAVSLSGRDFVLFFFRLSSFFLFSFFFFSFLLSFSY